MKASLAIAGLTWVALSYGVAARERAKPAVPPKPTCERASYPGDPVCDVGNAIGSLPMPTDRYGRREREGGVAVTDDLRVKGRSDFNNNRYGGTQFYNPNMHPRGADVNGGGGVDYKF